MTNKEYLSTLSNDDWYNLVDWLFHNYSMQYTDSRIAIIEWLDKEHNAVKNMEIKEVIEILSDILSDYKNDNLNFLYNKDIKALETAIEILKSYEKGGAE